MFYYFMIKMKSDGSYLLRKYWLWIILLSIPGWNVFENVYDRIGVSEHESTATGTVILIFSALYLGRLMSGILYKQKSDFVQRDIVVLSVLAVVAILFLLVVLKKPHYSGNSGAVIMINLLVFVIAGIAGYAWKMTKTLLENRLRDSEKSVLISKSELQLLQSQLSPHFLFNTLNNLYGLSLSKDDRLPGLLLKLSEMLRHSVYQTEDTFVSLEEETDYIENYIDFERIRLGDRLDLKVDIDQVATIKIAPMLLIIFIENAFKHSKNTADDKIFIEISLKIWESNILFSVYNTFDAAHVKNNELNKNSGLGLENVRRRLELLYPDSHHLRIEEGTNKYKVILQLKAR